ncbi:MAG: sll0787 family AIR synthase-like protein [Chthoniobacteraceae bacterium]
MSGLDDRTRLARLVKFLAANAAVKEKATIHSAYAPAESLAGDVRLGDDCAAIPDGDGWLLFAAEGMLESFVQADPWFAGYSAVMVNLSDVAAMGGRPVAVVDVLWTPGGETPAEIWAGMSAASQAYGVPVVGGHTTKITGGSAYLAAAVLGKASHLITSFDAKPGDDLVMAVDLRGAWRRDKPFWNASVDAPPERLRADLELLPALAESGLCDAGKDISNGGIVGTLAMLLECSRVGAELWLDLLPQPPGGDLQRWLSAFPSFGYLLSVRPKKTAAVVAHFGAREITCAPVGRITAEPLLVLGHGAARAPFFLPAMSRLAATSL